MVCHVCQLSVAKFAGVRPVMIKEKEDRIESNHNSRPLLSAREIVVLRDTGEQYWEALLP